MTWLIGAYVVYALTLSLALARAGFRHGPARSAGGTPARPTRILVIGATGGTGRHLVAQALARGYGVTALVREPARVTLRHPNLAVVRGDVRDAASLGAAMAGHEAVVSALGHKRFLGPSRILSEGTRNILRAMEEHRVPRLVCETSLGIGDSAFRMGLAYTLFTIPVVLPFYFWDKTRQERLIAASSVAWVIVRPGVLTDGDRVERVRHGRDVGAYVLSPRISRSDVAAFMLDQLESDAFIGSAPGVASSGGMR